MLTTIVTTAFGFFGAAVGTGLYIAGKKAGKQQAEKEQLQAMRESFFHGDPLKDLIPLVLVGGMLNAIPTSFSAFPPSFSAGFPAPAKEPTPPTPTKQN